MDSIVSFAICEPFHGRFFTVLAGVSTVANAFLIVVVCSHNCKHLGNYRILLTAFAIFDILTSLTHYAVEPMFHHLGYGIIFFSRRAYVEWHDMGVFTITYYQTYLILAFHFVYRLKAIDSNQFSWADHLSTRQWMIIGFIINFLYAGALVFVVVTFLSPGPDDKIRSLLPSLDLYGVNSRDPNFGLVAAIYLDVDMSTGAVIGINWKPIFSAGLVLFLIAISFVIIVYCILRIRSMLSSGSNMTSSRTRNLQRQLFRALLIQFAVPLLVCVLPLFISFLIPITGIQMGASGNIFLMTTALFPVLDPIILILFVELFRQTVRGWLMTSTSVTNLVDY